MLTTASELSVEFIITPASHADITALKTMHNEFSNIEEWMFNRPAKHLEKLHAID